MKFVLAFPKNDVGYSFIDDNNIKLIESLGELVRNPSETKWTEEEFAEALKGADAVITSWGSPCLTENALKYADNLKLLIHAGGTVVPFVSEALWNKGIRVISGNDYFAESVAEGVIGYMLTALRDIPKHITEFTQNHRWQPKELNSKSLIGKTVGLVSYGAVSRYLVKLLKPFRVKINIYDVIDIPEADLLEYNMTQTSLETVFAESDIVSLHTPLNPATYHMIGSKLLSMIKDGALFLNTARGAVVDEAAMIEELKKERFTALLDVYETEPPARDNPLYTMKNVYMMPHKAGPTRDIYPDIARALINEAYNFVTKGEALSHEIHRSVAEKMSRS